MKKRMIALLLAVLTAVSLMTMPAAAAGNSVTRFSDITDQGTATAVETLRLMGVLGGYGDGTFRPNGQLTRAQFCKMVTYAINSESEIGLYKTVTVFPDVKPSHWAAPYINLAAKGKSIIGGYPDGNFQPERTVTVGHAVTILLRLLGYKDADIGGVWPDSYVAAGSAIGLTDGVGTDGNMPLTRARAARLFVNLLQAEKTGGGTLYALGEETVLSTVDGAAGTMKTADGKTYPMAYPAAETALVGATGRVVLNADGKALTFLPTGGSAGNTAASVIVYADRSAAGLAEMAGGTDYTIYKNGQLATLNDLRKNDVATYNPVTNAVLVCDTKVHVYYEGCEPNPEMPATITVLGGMTFDVLPSAWDTLSMYRPGAQMVLLLTTEGKVAAVLPGETVLARDAVGLVAADGSVQLLCGTKLLPMTVKAAEEAYGRIVRVSAGKRGEVSLMPITGRLSGDLNVVERTLGSRKLAPQALIFDSGVQVTLADITMGIVPERLVTYARTNWAGEVDLLLINGGVAGEIYGRAVVTRDEYEPEVVTITVEAGTGKSVSYLSGYAVRTGDYVAVTENPSKTGYSGLTKLTALMKVPNRAWLGTSAVTYGGQTYAVPANVLCYNRDSQEWITLEQAQAYSKTLNLYIKDGIVRLVEAAS